MNPQKRSLFDYTDRTDARTIQPGGSNYAFLNRRAHQDVQRVREFIDDLAAEYARMHGQKALKQVAALLRSGDNGQHSGGHFELVMNRVLTRAGCTVKAIEPELPNGKRPDFLVEAINGEEFYLETRVVTKLSEFGWLGLGDSKPKEVHPEAAIRSRLIDEKMVRYGDPGKPMIVAVNTLDLAADRVAFEDVLVGSFGIRASMAGDGTVGFEIVRGLGDGVNDGVLACEACENVSAFMFFRCCNPGNEPNAWYCLSHNPFAKWPLRCAFPSFYRAIYRKHAKAPGWRWYYRDGADLGELLGLPDNWPHEPIDPKVFRRCMLLVS